MRARARQRWTDRSDRRRFPPALSLENEGACESLNGIKSAQTSRMDIFAWTSLRHISHIISRDMKSSSRSFLILSRRDEMSNRHLPTDSLEL